ncbi:MULTISPECIES: hypothetical protein [unclassified Rathayibacter]|uniref:COG1470 family protein n=1 Tax=unclassified Rathayibacter TaxID=2609250 RepID=UPI0015E27E4D|nr:MULTISPECIES: hypothetical protein [unclassified Rathayibacter]
MTVSTRPARAIAVVLGVFFSALLAAPAAAGAPTDTAITWAATPASNSGPDGRSWVEAELDPGAIRSEHLAIRNLGGVDATFTLSAADGYLTPSGRFSMLPSTTSSIAAGTWIDVADTVTVAAGTTVVVPYTITVPANAEPGDHAAGIAASIRSESAEGDATSVGVESRIGFRVMTHVSGTVFPALDTSATAEYQTRWNPLRPGQIHLAYTLRNTGNVRLAVAAAVEYDGRRISANENVDGVLVELLPGDTRVLNVTVPEVWPLGAVGLPLEASYSAIAPDGGSTPSDVITDEVVVWALPWPQLIVVAAVVLLVLGLFGGRIRRGRALTRLMDEAREAGRREARSEGLLEPDSEPSGVSFPRVTES